MEESSETRIEIGYGSAQDDDAFTSGTRAAQQALADIHIWPLVAVIVFASAEYDLKEVLRGIRTVAPDGLLFGCTGACEICNEPLSKSVVVTFLASPFMRVSCGLGREVSRDWQHALDEAVDAPEMRPYFHDAECWQLLTLKGKSVFAILFSPGNTRSSTSSSYEILEAINGKSLGRLPVFGGCSADNWRMDGNYVFLDGEAFPDSMILAIFETQLQFGIAMDHGFIPTLHQTTATSARGHVVFEFDEKPAADVFAGIVGSERSALEGKHLALATGRTLGTSDPMGRFSINVPSYLARDGGINFTQPVTAGTVLTLMEPDPRNFFSAGQEALRKAMMRGAIGEPALVLIAYCALRPQIAGVKSAEEIRIMAAMLAGTPLIGFCSFGEQGVSDDGTNRHNNGVVSVLVLGGALSANASVALENEKMQGQLEQQTLELYKLSSRLEHRVEERTAELSAANERLRHEIVERINVEEQLQQSNLRFKTLADATFEGIIVSENGRYVDANPQLTQILGYDRSELIGQELTVTVPPAERSLVLENIRSNKESIVQHQMVRKDGTYCYVEAQGRPVLQNGRTLRITAIRDITDRKKMEQALRQSEELFKTLCNSAPVGIFKSDCVGNITYVNPHCERITGLPAYQWLGKGWLRIVHPGDREFKTREWLDAVAARRPCSQEFRLITPQGKTLLVRAQASPLTYQAGNCPGYVGIVSDITEIRKATQDNIRAQKMESLGVLAGGIAHDFNNILTGILGNVSLARFQIDHPDKVAQRLEAAENSAARARDLTQQLLTFARGGEPVKKTLNVADVLKDSAVFACHGSEVRCDFVLGEDLWPVNADEGQLSQVINNLVLNAVQAMPAGGTVTIGAENDAVKQPGKRLVKIFVTDTGSGIYEDHIQRVFDPYFTTKEKGSGLGLATCFSIVKKHDGIITFESSPGSGTTFYVYLPALELAPPVSHRKEALLERGGGRILLMDDEEVVCEIGKAMLEELGYSVVCAKNGSEAIETYLRRKVEGTPFAAVIMDLTIPGGMGGKEAVKMLLSVDPKAKAIVSSGYSNDPVMANFRDYGFVAVLKKPYRLQDIGVTLQQCLVPA